MPLLVALRAPDYPTTSQILFTDDRVTMDIVRKTTVAPLPGNKVASIDTRTATRYFTITGKVIAEGGSTAKTRFETLEDASLNWASKTNPSPPAGTPANASTFVFGTKQDDSDKDYKVFVRKLTMIHDSLQFGGGDNVFVFTLVLDEVGPLSASG